MSSADNAVFKHCCCSELHQRTNPVSAAAAVWAFLHLQCGFCSKILNRSNQCTYFRENTDFS